MEAEPEVADLPEDHDCSHGCYLTHPTIRSLTYISTSDHELDAVQIILAALENLDDVNKVRVLSYIKDRFDTPGSTWESWNTRPVDD